MNKNIKQAALVFAFFLVAPSLVSAAQLEHPTTLNTATGGLDVVGAGGSDSHVFVEEDSGLSNADLTTDAKSVPALSKEDQLGAVLILSFLLAMVFLALVFLAVGDVPIIALLLLFLLTPFFAMAIASVISRLL